MSAFLVTNETLNLIVNAHPDGPTREGFELLLKQNLDSLAARYPGRDFLADWYQEAKGYTYQPNPLGITGSPTQVIKACDCYDYQACETDDYNTSIARDYVLAVQGAMLARGGKTEGPAYQSYAWE